MGERVENVFSDVFLAEMDKYRVTVDNAILTELHQRKDSPFFTPLSNALKGGKRLRPILLLLAFESVDGGGLGKDPLPAAVAVELIHSGSLIEDDIIDRDLMRRETATFHSVYGPEISLLSTFEMLSMILDITARYLNPRITRALARVISRMSNGEFEELKIYKRGQPVSTDEYINIISKKTASLFQASATIGTIIAGAHEDEINALSDYGRLLGIAYQIQDDLMDQGEDKTINVLSLLDTRLEKEKYLQELSTSYLLEARRRLQELKTSESKSNLIALADLVGMRAINRKRGLFER
jgi:octaprenyl-diphosphate synthase